MASDGYLLFGTWTLGVRAVSRPSCVSRACFGTGVLDLDMQLMTTLSVRQGSWPCSPSADLLWQPA